MTRRPGLMTWFAACATIFFTRALLFATWQARGPEVRDALHLNTAQMGVFVMFYPLGGLLGILFAERLTARFGSRALTAIGFSLAAASMAALGPALSAGSTVLAGLLLVLMGLPMAMADFIGNFEGTQVDRLASRSLFPAIHSA